MPIEETHCVVAAFSGQIGATAGVTFEYDNPQSINELEAAVDQTTVFKGILAAIAEDRASDKRNVSCGFGTLHGYGPIVHLN